ncbi:longitudinals lacking protein, isoforms H/M/V-like isoform X1 [Thrips palmi]|uniref:Longitudinals lacking protein, isoforms H/M/V-like isoform X1 n=1 Tax=Thrips palmi TaxID=161013 RepID=A0A6P8XYJ1_THRPL|nr:longitudinals lacking protein, isoforms H/M/V-like isoform X1 [Thrips palmi]XP_034232154.1 longitudinals lacking protein, isoforms H/M/V-like isoform X1 [Thrips palmi]
MATAEQFSLRWNNFQSNMTSGFHALWEGEDLVDVTLAADGRFLQAHKVVLSVCSPYFKTLFKVNPCKHPIVILKDVAYKDLEALLQFMYRGEVNVCQEELGGFLKTAEMLEVKGLTGDDSQRSSSPSNQMQQPQALPSKPSKDRTHLSGKLVSASMVLSDDSRSIHSSQFKRKRVSGPVSPATANSVNEENSNTRGHSEYPELAHPKVEPRDMDTDDGGDSYSAEKDASDSLVTLLAGESSHGGIHSEGMDPAVFSSMSAHGQGDSTGTQDASQGNHFEEEDEDGKPSSLPSKAENPELGYSLQVLRHSLSIHNSSRGVSILKKNIINQLWRPNASRVTSEYRCTLCQKTFTRRDHLRTHERNLHGQDAGPFTCCICMQLYKNADSLRKHVTKYHFSREVATSTSTATTATTDVPS